MEEEEELEGTIRCSGSSARLAIKDQVRTQFGVSPSERQKRGDVKIVHYLQDAAGARNLDLRPTHDRRLGYGSSSQERGDTKTRRACVWMCS